MSTPNDGSQEGLDRELTPFELRIRELGGTMPNPDQDPEAYIDRQREIVEQANILILAGLAMRFEATDNIGRAKALSGISIIQLDHFLRMKEGILPIGSLLGLDEDVTSDFLDFLHQKSVQRQLRIL